MREVFIHQDSARVGLYKSVLDSAGIENFVRNALTNNSIAEMPSPIFFPALCVLNDEDYLPAIELLRKVVKPEPSDAADWTCAKCGETVPGTFDTCWKCGTEHEPGEDLSPPPLPPPTAAPMPMAPTLTADPAQTLAVVNAFRLLLIVGFVWSLAQSYLFPYFGIHIVIEPPGDVGAFLQRHSPRANWQQFAWGLQPILKALTLVAFPLCFCLSRHGRPCFVLLVLLHALAILGYPLAIGVAWWGPAFHLQSLLTGALLAMMYLPPLSGIFSRKE